ncbi:hypothetical protein KAU88_06620 [Candidatus Bathyarchaeota archaeon]|nr:hypothetical protein [Candidatus Bathyarchaeota archaeon]
MVTTEEQLDKITQEFIESVRTLFKKGILTKEMLQDYREAKAALHGLLESAFISAGWRIGFYPIVEPRVPLDSPLVPGDYSPQLKGKRRRNQFRPDIGYYRAEKLDIFIECCTTDEAKEFEPSKLHAHITKRDAFLHFVKHAKVSAFIMCVVLPSDMVRRPPWKWAKESSNDFFTEFKLGWSQLANNLHQHIPTRLIILNENGVYSSKTWHAYLE